MGKESDHAANQKRREFVEKWSEHSDRLFPYVSKLTGNKDDAEDITLEALVCYVKHMDKNGWEAEIENTGAYLRRTAHNLYMDLCKRRNREVQLGYEDDDNRQTHQEAEREAATTDETVVRIEDASHFGKLLSDLPKAVLHGFTEYELELLRLRKVEGLSCEEAAGVVQKDVYRVRYDLNKIEARLRYRVRRILEGKDGGDTKDSGDDK